MTYMLRWDGKNGEDSGAYQCTECDPIEDLEPAATLNCVDEHDMQIARHTFCISGTPPCTI